MNPMSNVKGILNMNQKELELGLSGTNTSWHSKYKDSAWIFVGGLPYDLTEGDTICVFSQYGEIVNINLVRDKQTGKSKGYCFICYEDQRSTILAVDNLNGIKVLGRTIRVDHVSNYKMPKEGKDEVLDDITKKLRLEGCAPQMAAPAGEEEEELELSAKKVKKDKKAKKKKKKEKKMKKEKKKKSSSDSDSESSTEEASQPSKIKTEIDGTKYPKVKKEKEDSVYEKYAQRGSKEKSPNRSRDHGSNIVPSSSTQKDNKQNRREDWERSQERNRDRGQERNRDRSQERNRERNPERNRDRSQERNRDRRYDSRSPDRYRDQNDNTTHRGRDRQTSRDREFRHQGNRSHDSNRHQDRSRDRSREQERGGSRDRSRDRGKGDRRREDGYRERSRSRERNYRR